MSGAGQPATVEVAPDTASERALANDVLDGLTRPFKEISPKYLYDARGSELFERITELPEYYPTRAELEALRAHAPAIVAAGGAAELVELGAGASTKARVLLDAMDAAGTLRRYVAVDVSPTVVDAAAQTLAADYPDLELRGLVGDFQRDLDRIAAPAPGRPRLVALLGGTIGNLPPGTRRALLAEIAAVLGPGGHLLLGTDLVKDPRVIEAAYDDDAGVTAAFNRNLLTILNRELSADFPVDNFAHVAFYDREREWVEMRLRARRPCSVYLAALELRVEFAAGEELRTEISAKFTPRRIDSDLAAAGLEPVRRDTDAAGRFAVTLARAAG